MKTIEVKLYEFDELPDEAKKNAIRNYESRVFTDFIYIEAKESVKKFCDLFNISTGRRWTDFKSIYLENCEPEELYGDRLLRWIWNNLMPGLLKGKYYSTPGKWIDGKYHYKFRYSNVFLEADNCPLTGMCYDMDLIDPILKYIKNFKYQNPVYHLGDLMDDCFNSIRKAIEDEVDYRLSDEGIQEEIEQCDVEFTESGNIY